MFCFWWHDFKYSIMNCTSDYYRHLLTSVVYYRNWVHISTLWLGNDLSWRECCTFSFSCDFAMIPPTAKACTNFYFKYQEDMHDSKNSGLIEILLISTRHGRMLQWTVKPSIIKWIVIKIQHQNQIVKTALISWVLACATLPKTTVRYKKPKALKQWSEPSFTRIFFNVNSRLTPV